MDRRSIVLEAAWKVFTKFGYKKGSMADIAEAANISRPTLYSAFPDKESVFAALVEQTIQYNTEETARRLVHAKSLEAKLSQIIAVWIVDPYAKAMEMDNGPELVLGSAIYAPQAMARLWEEFEHHISQALGTERKKSDVSNKELAAIFASSCRDFKASAKSVSALKKATHVLVKIALGLGD